MIRRMFIVGLITGLISTYAYGQLESLDFFIGPSVTSTHGQGRSIDSFGGLSNGSLYHFTTGIGATFAMTDRSALSIKILYEDRGSKGSYRYGYINGVPLKFADRYEEHIRHYTLPLLYSFRFGNIIRFSLDAGPHVSFQAYRNIQFYMNDIPIFKEEYHDDDRFEFGVTTGFNMEIPVAMNLDVTVGLLDNLGLSSMAKTTPSFYTNMISLTCGVRFKLRS